MIVFLVWFKWEENKTAALQKGHWNILRVFGVWFSGLGSMPKVLDLMVDAGGENALGKEKIQTWGLKNRIIRQYGFSQFLHF